MNVPWILLKKSNEFVVISADNYSFW